MNYARWQDINPDDALELTNKKFKQRFEAIESHAKKLDIQLESMSLEEMEAVWQNAKG